MFFFAGYGTIESVVPELTITHSVLPRGAMTLSKFLTILRNPFDPVRLSTGHFTSISQSPADVNALPPATSTFDKNVSIRARMSRASLPEMQVPFLWKERSPHFVIQVTIRPRSGNYPIYFSLLFLKKITVMVQRNLECVQFRFSCRTTIIARFEPNSTQDN